MNRQSHLHPGRLHRVASLLTATGLIALAISPLAAATPKDAAYYAARGITFYAPFEDTLNAVYSAGRVDAVNPHTPPLYPQQGLAFVAGKVGHCASAEEIALSYDPSKIFFPDRGAVSFWFKPVGSSPRAIFHVPAEEWGVGPNSRLHQELYTDTFLFGAAPLVREGFFRAMIRPALDAVDSRFNLTLDPGRWYHFAWTWDNTQGMRGWLDGQPLFDSWGTTTWVQMMTPRIMQFANVAALDELVFFNRALDADDVRALVSGELPGARPQPEPYAIPELLRGYVAHSYGLDELPAYPVVEPGAPVTFAPVDFERALDGKRPVLYCLDGNRVSCWPDSHIELVNTDQLDISYPAEVEANYFRVVSDGRRFAVTKDDDPQPFWIDEVRPERDSWEDKLVRRHFTADPVRFRRLRLDRKGSRVAEFYVYRVERAPLSVAGAEVRSFRFDRVADIRSLPWEGAVYQRYHNHASPVALGSAGPARAQAIPGNPLVPFHLVSPAFAAKTGVAGVSLNLALVPPKEKQEDIIRVRIVDPVTRERDLINTEFRLRFDLAQPGPQVFRLAFDLPDWVYNAGTRVWLWLVSKEGSELSLAESSLAIHTVPVEVAARPMVAQTLRQIAHSFSHSSEPHVWTRSFKWPGDEDLQYAWSEWPALPNLIRERLAPDNRIIGTYWNAIRPKTNPSYAKWVDYSRGKPVRELEQPAIEAPRMWANPAGAPDWALYQNELLKSLTRVVHWWHDNRLVAETGVLGGYGDDTQFTGDAFWIYFATGDAKLFRILQSVTEGTWKYSGVQRGFPSRINDVGHDAEEVVGTWPLMIVADYGNPRYVEMSMETMSLADLFMTRTARGHRHFRSWYMGANGVKTEGEHGVDNLANAQFALLGHSLGWYNGNPKLAEIYREWCDAWLEDFERAKVAGPSGPISIRMPDDTPVPHVEAMSPHNLQHHFYVTGLLTGDAKYVARALNYRDEVFLGSAKGEWSEGMLLRNFAADRRRLLEDPALRKSRSMTRPDDVFTRYVISGDKSVLAADYRARLEQFAGPNEYLMTEGQPSLDRLYGLFNETMFLAMLGGSPTGHRRSTTWPGMAVSLPDAANDLASLVLDTAASELKLLLFNFNPQRGEVALRLWHLDPGEYEVTAGPDRNGDDQMDAVGFSARVTIRRGSRVTVPVPFGLLQVIRFRQVARADLPGLLPDLAVSHEDVTYDARAGALDVTVHNIGSAAAGRFVVTILDRDGKTLAAQAADGLAAPVDLKPRTVRFRFTMDGPRAACVDVVVAPVGWKVEITDDNNRTKAPSILP